MERKFREVEEGFQKLRRQFRRGEISRREFVDQLKKLRLRDEEGRFWMIGAQTGKWYYFDGNDWVLATPPQVKAQKTVCPHCGFENFLDDEICSRCGENLKEGENRCLQCGRIIEDSLAGCPVCNRTPKFIEAEEKSVLPLALTARENVVLRRVAPLSFLIFSGGAGVILGVVLGAFAGATDYFSGFGKTMPGFFQELQGKLMGGIIFAGLGGIFGFISFAALGFLAAVLFNNVSSFMGGIEVQIAPRAQKKKKEEASEVEDKETLS